MTRASADTRLDSEAIESPNEALLAEGDGISVARITAQAPAGIGTEAVSDRILADQNLFDPIHLEPARLESDRNESDLAESPRVQLDLRLEPMPISGVVLHELCRHALDVAPEECCGLVLGQVEEPFVRSVRITNIMTKKHLEDPDAFPRDAYHAYYMSEVEYQNILEEAEARSEYVSAIYHSHVEQGCYLSQDDLAFAVHPLFPFPEASQIVVSILGEDVDEVGIFDRDDRSAPQFVGRRLRAAAGVIPS